MNQTVAENGIDYEVEEEREVMITDAHVVGNGSHAIFAGWQPGSSKIDNKKGGFEWLKIEKNGTNEPHENIYHPLNQRLRVNHCQFYRTGDKWKMRVLVQTCPKDPWPLPKSLTKP
jgi:hypothetical protein